jgi:hypothetical protein
MRTAASEVVVHVGLVPAACGHCSLSSCKGMRRLLGIERPFLMVPKDARTSQGLKSNEPALSLDARPDRLALGAVAGVRPHAGFDLAELRIATLLATGHDLLCASRSGQGDHESRSTQMAK